MLDQQLHLSELVEQQTKLTEQLQTLTMEMNNKRDLLLKVQGAIEYLQQIGVSLPQTQESSNVEETKSVE